MAVTGNNRTIYNLHTNKYKDRSHGELQLWWKLCHIKDNSLMKVSRNVPWFDKEYFDLKCMYYLHM